MQNIKYPLNSEEKSKIRARFEEVLNKKKGEQVIILIDENLITDHYQNVDGDKMLKTIEESAREFSGLTNNNLIYFK